MKFTGLDLCGLLFTNWPRRDAHSDTDISFWTREFSCPLERELWMAANNILTLRTEV